MHNNVHEKILPAVPVSSSEVLVIPRVVVTIIYFIDNHQNNVQYYYYKPVFLSSLVGTVTVVALGILVSSGTKQILLF